MQHEIITTPHSPIDNELRALMQEQHSPSSAVIHTALLIAQRTEIGYGDIYTIIPRAQHAGYAAMAATEMEARCPFLLAAIRGAIAANRNRLVVETLFAPPTYLPQTLVQMSGHERVEALPSLIAWLMGAQTHKETP
jgi:hypothetical protein